MNKNDRINRKYWAMANYIGSELIERELKINPELFDHGPVHSHMSDSGKVTFHNTAATEKRVNNDEQENGHS